MPLSVNPCIFVQLLIKPCCLLTDDDDDSSGCSTSTITPPPPLDSAHCEYTRSHLSSLVYSQSSDQLVEAIESRAAPSSPL